ncbi:MAG TPA: hypothetical protein VHI51_16645 [Ktedonobacterales bacterium]|jgi:hypothetical protein|nr:hypothetical protein [Ktedonobacterales bacterium]
MPETRKAAKPQETSEETTQTAEKAESVVNQAATAFGETLREAGRTVVDGAIAMQDRNAHFAQTIIEQGFKQVEEQTVALHKLYSAVASQSEARRAAFRDLGREAAAASFSLLMLPARRSRRVFESARETVRETVRESARPSDSAEA